jgi:hypothetical protein
MNESFQIGTASAAAGERGDGHVEVAQRSDGTLISMAVIIVNGARPGPTLCLSGGIHGNEYAGIEAVSRLARNLDPDDMAGTLVAVPVVNPVSFDNLDLFGHYDHINLNRSFPGSPSGLLTQRIAHTFLNEVVSRCDALVDLHTGGKARIMPLVIAQGDYLDLSKDLAQATGMDLAWLGGPWTGTGRLAALEAGIPAITIEAGGGMECREVDVLEHVRAVNSVMRHLGMLTGEPDRAPRCRVMTGAMTYSQHGGLFRTSVALEDAVKQGQVIARITDPFGDTLEEIRADRDGIAAMIRVVPTVRPGETLFILGEIVDHWESTFD